MLINTTANTTATCRLTEDGEDIMTLSGSLNANGTYSVNHYVHNRALYKANRKQMAADEDAFEDMLLAQTAGSVSEEEE